MTSMPLTLRTIFLASMMTLLNEFDTPPQTCTQA
jgi:hypothetical protein